MIKDDCNNCNNFALYPYSTICLMCGGSPKNRKPHPANADKLRAMSDEELAEFCVWMCPPGSNEILACEPERKLCYECWLDWLRQEVTE